MKKGKEAVLYKLLWDYEGIYIELLQRKGEYENAMIDIAR